MVETFVIQGLRNIDKPCMLSWFPEIGDYVEQDEEIATIETDKVRDFPKTNATFY